MPAEDRSLFMRMSCFENLLHSTSDDPVLIALPDRDGNVTCKM